MWMTIIVLGLTGAACLGYLAFVTKHNALRITFVAATVVVLIATLVMSSVRFVPADRVGIVTKNALGPSLTDGRIVATDGEMGVQADVLAPGWHFGYWPVLFDIDTVPLTEILAGQVGLVEARDGVPLDEGQLFAPEVTSAEFKRKIEDARHFLTEGQGRKGPQSNVLTPGSYRINTKLFNVRTVSATQVPEAAVAVLKANFGDTPTIETQVGDNDQPVLLAGPNERGVRVRGEVSYDTNNNSVTFSPLAPLAEGTAFTMTLDGVRDVAGNTAPTINASFRTFLA
ncbi:MAG: Ig-like domain-containing protein, partial [Planctomycetota bacterium]